MTHTMMVVAVAVAVAVVAIKNRIIISCKHFLSNLCPYFWMDPIHTLTTPTRH